MATLVPDRCKPIAPSEGNFRLRGVDDDDFNETDWPRDPSEYRPTTHFLQQYREYDRVLSDDVINNAITEGILVPALDDCAAFALDSHGVVYYFIVGADLERNNPWDGRVVVTAWPWVYDREIALDNGYSTLVLNRMQELNSQFMNESTSDDDWLEYYETIHN